MVVAPMWSCLIAIGALSVLQRGFGTAACAVCMTSARKLEGIGKLEATSTSDPQLLHCNMCLTHERQVLEDQLIREVGGPSPQELLAVLALKMPWFLVLSKASPEAKLTALSKLKRQMEHASTDRELGMGLANHSDGGILHGQVG